MMGVELRGLWVVHANILAGNVSVGHDGRWAREVKRE